MISVLMILFFFLSAAGIRSESPEQDAPGFQKAETEKDGEREGKQKPFLVGDFGRFMVKRRSRHWMVTPVAQSDGVGIGSNNVFSPGESAP